MFVMVYKFIGELVIGLLGFVGAIITITATITALTWLRALIHVPTGYTSEDLVTALYLWLIMLPSLVLAGVGYQYLWGKVIKFLDKDF
jgi:hypothetical protein